jgi:histidinol phosphatase-like enzyme
LPHALDALRLLAENAYIALVVSRPACVGKDLLSCKDLDAVTWRFLRERARSGGNIAAVYDCRHAAEDLCHGCKSRPGLVVRAHPEHRLAPEETLLWDDSPNALLAAHATRLLFDPDPPRSVPRGAQRPQGASIVACDRCEAAKLVLAARDMQQDAALPQE